MTDPRVSALAEALRGRYGFDGSDGWGEDAAAILAALPPDWCGHEAEIARLRKIEEAARDVADRSEVVSDPEGLGGEWCHYCDHQTPGHGKGCEIVALRAALSPAGGEGYRMAGER